MDYIREYYERIMQLQELRKIIKGQINPSYPMKFSGF